MSISTKRTGLDVKGTKLQIRRDLERNSWKCGQRVQENSEIEWRLNSQNVNVRIYVAIILPVALCVCETCPLALREEHRLRVIRRIFGPRR
jgi:hypothetical protein